MTTELLFLIGGLGISVIGYFLRQTMQDLKNVKEVAYNTKTKVEVLEAQTLIKIDNLNNKFDMLSSHIKDLTNEIKELNKKIK